MNGLHAIEVFPALALPALEPAILERKRAARYNPDNRRKFSHPDWRLVALAASRHAASLHLDDLAKWARNLAELPEPTKTDQDWPRRRHLPHRCRAMAASAAQPANRPWRRPIRLHGLPRHTRNPRHPPLRRNQTHRPNGRALVALPSDPSSSVEPALSLPNGSGVLRPARLPLPPSSQAVIAVAQAAIAVAQAACSLGPARQRLPHPCAPLRYPGVPGRDPAATNHQTLRASHPWHRTKPTAPNIRLPAVPRSSSSWRPCRGSPRGCPLRPPPRPLSTVRRQSASGARMTSSRSISRGRSSCTVFQTISRLISK